MTAGNLYRYFASKDALVAGLCERDRADLAAEFEAFQPEPGNFLAAFAAFGRKHFEDGERDKAALCLEIWAEAARNPLVAGVHNEFDRDIIRHLIQIFEDAKRSGAMAPDVDSTAAASILAKLADGLFVRRAIAPDFDPDREIREVFAVVKALVDGAIVLSRAAGGTEDRPCSPAA
ncbi:TetR family transcriptional regulator C-terminal domain-containing protein [Propylenella binzhouense]